MPDEKHFTNQEICERLQEATICDFNPDVDPWHLSNMERMVEEYRTKQERKTYRKVKTRKEVRSMISSVANITDDTVQLKMLECELSSYDKYYIQGKGKYEIKVIPNKDIPPDTGMTQGYAYGATVMYPKIEQDEPVEGVTNHLYTHIILSHEIGGHLLLYHIPSWLEEPRDDPDDMYEIEPYQEIEAFRCSEIILGELSKKYRAQGIACDFITVTPQELRDAIYAVSDEQYKPKDYFPDLL